MLGFMASAFCATPPFRGKQRLFRYSFGLLPYRFARSRYGVKMKRNSNDATYRFCMLGSYGRFISDLLEKQTAPFAFLDIGANQGIFTLIAAKNPACASVLAFEPNPRTYAFLVENIDANQISEKVLPICGAIAPGDQDILTFSTSAEHSGAANLFGRGNSGFSALRIGEGTLRSLFDRLGEGPIVAKIDVEGAETLVLQALADAGLLNRIDCIIAEVSELTGDDGEAPTLDGFLTQAGWHRSAQSGSGNHYDALYRRAGTS